MERSNIVYTTILVILLVALVTVGTLLLRKRSMLPQERIGPPGRTVTAPPDTVPLEEHRFEEPWKVGDPEPIPLESDEEPFEEDIVPLP